MRIDNSFVHFCYLISNEKDKRWDITVNTIGHQMIGKNENYPKNNHPSRYLFSPEKGRVLNEYQLLYIVKGKGNFVSKNQKAIDLRVGNLFMLFPGEWHNYHPDKDSGWTEYWIGFEGESVDKKYENGFFTKTKPVFNIGLHEEIIELYERALLTAQNQHVGFQQILSGIVNLLLGYTYSYSQYYLFEDMKVMNQINEAKILMSDHYNEGMDTKEVADSVHMSYSWFRHLFKQYTGFAPNQYMIEIRIQKSKELLTNTFMPIKEISYRVGFENPEYFSALFKKRVKSTPAAYREFTQKSWLANKGS